MERILKFPVTVILVVINVTVFVLCYFQINTFDEPAWSANLYGNGALFNPATLDGQWYRIFTSMFLHGHIWHLLLNMVALFMIGNEVEQQVGSVKFLWVYFISGVTSALVSLYWNLFVVGVGASGAIFGLFGFAIVIRLYYSKGDRSSVAQTLINFFFFLAINLVFAKVMHADNAAHFGGLIGGLILGAVGYSLHKFRRVVAEYIMIPVLFLIYVTLPRYQVHYYKFFQQVLATEDSVRSLFGRDLSDHEFSTKLKESNQLWDSVALKLKQQREIPSELQLDTFKLRRYISLRKQENEFRVQMIDKESYIYLDSMDLVNDSIKSYLSLEYVLIGDYSAIPESKPQPEEKEPTYEMTKVWFDKDWQETAEPGPYFRIGGRDSLNQWQGRVTDFYGNGDIQMKGSYKDNKKDGVFLYYSNHKTYESAGRYRNDRNVGKWESFHHNGILESEVYYTDRYFLKSLWDSTGHQLIINGSGKQTEYYDNGAVSNEGQYREGYKEGYWSGRHPDGSMYFEENFFHGRLTRGKSRNLKGETFVYDETSQYPLPEGGYDKFNRYLFNESDKYKGEVKGDVKLSFRVTKEHNIVDIEIEEGVSKEADAKAKEILLNGPRWLPGKIHGQQPAESYSFITIQFK